MNNYSNQDQVYVILTSTEFGIFDNLRTPMEQISKDDDVFLSKENGMKEAVMCMARAHEEKYGKELGMNRLYKTNQFYPAPIKDSKIIHYHGRFLN